MRNDNVITAAICLRIVAVFDDSFFFVFFFFPSCCFSYCVIKTFLQFGVQKLFLVSPFHTVITFSASGQEGFFFGYIHGAALCNIKLTVFVKQGMLYTRANTLLFFFCSPKFCERPSMVILNSMHL